MNSPSWYDEGATFSRRYNVWQRAMFRLSTACGIQLYALMSNKTVRPGLFYRGFKLKVSRVFSFLIWGHA
jgi:hypothetical protein